MATSPCCRTLLALAASMIEGSPCNFEARGICSQGSRSLRDAASSSKTGGRLACDSHTVSKWKLEVFERPLRREITGGRYWPGRPVHSRVRQLTLAFRAHGSKVNFLTRPRTHVPGQEPSAVTDCCPPSQPIQVPSCSISSANRSPCERATSVRPSAGLSWRAFAYACRASTVRPSDCRASAWSTGAR